MIVYRDRLSGLECIEKGFAPTSLNFFYGNSILSRSLGRLSSLLVAKLPLCSFVIGWWYRLSRSKQLIRPFIETFEIDPQEFSEEVDSFANFNAFFIRHLKKNARPIAEGDHVAVMPADGRYLFYPDLTHSDGWVIKGKKFDMARLLGSSELAKKYCQGSMVIARLCPADYHRFHFPCRCTPGETILINGPLYSVHPRALKSNLRILVENKRFITPLRTNFFGDLLYIEIGATGVGSTIQTFLPQQEQEKGSEKGYFEFGASCIILLFEKDAITFDSDLLQGPPHQEVRCLMGQSMGTAHQSRCGTI